MQTGLFTYLSSLAQRCRLLSEKCAEPRIKEEIGAISVELFEYAQSLKSVPADLNRR
jgi:hypothetical protein